METRRKNTGSAALGQYLGAKRLALGLSYRELAQKVGKAPSTIQAWEQGKRMPGLDDLFVLAHALHTELGELVDLAATPVRELEKRLAAAQERQKKALQAARRGGTAGRATRAAQEAAREVAFLQNLLAQRQKQQDRPRLPQRVVPLYDLKSVPLLGRIRAGRPHLAVEEAVGYTGVPHDVDVDYALTVEGDSMVGAGIAPGDVVWVKQAETANHGETVVALLRGEEVTVKHLIKEGERYFLRANNPTRAYPDLPLGPEDRIIGVVQRVVKKPGPPPRLPSQPLPR
ncbi:MAG: helix-turn-helix domain-containing protein [Clostridia bacterium]|nr:helix-turn-helix domain-containing protein [Clostridia bacterium]